MPLCLSCGYDTYSAAVKATFLELYCAVNEGIECVVLTHSYVSAGVVTCAALTYDDVACNALLATENFNT